MRQLLLTFLTILLYLHQTQAVCSLIWSFDCHERETWGHINHVYTSNSNPDFHIDLDRFTTNVKITASNITSLQKDLCSSENLPHLEMIWIRNVQLRSIANTALEHCKNLRVFKMNENIIENRLSKNTFKNNEKLEEMWLQGNKITYLAPTTFNHLRELVVLDLGGNDLEYFPADLVAGLRKLRLLALYSNNLLELDGKALANNLPALQYVYFNDNHLKCSDIKGIIGPFEATYVTVSSHSDMRSRSYMVKYSDGITCVGDETVSSEENRFVTTDWPPHEESTEHSFKHYYLDEDFSNSSFHNGSSSDYLDYLEEHYLNSSSMMIPDSANTVTERSFCVLFIGLIITALHFQEII